MTKEQQKILETYKGELLYISNLVSNHDFFEMEEEYVKELITKNTNGAFIVCDNSKHRHSIDVKLANTSILINISGEFGDVSFIKNPYNNGINNKIETQDILLRYKEELKACKKSIKSLCDTWIDKQNGENIEEYLLNVAKNDVHEYSNGILTVARFNHHKVYFVLCPSECDFCKIAMGYNDKEEFTSWVVQTKKQAKKEEMIMKKEKQVKEKQEKKANKFTVKQVVLTMIDKKGLLAKGSEIKKAFPEVLKEVEKYFPDTKFSYNCLAWYVAKARKGLIGTAKPVTKKPEVKKMKFKKAK